MSFLKIYRTIFFWILFFLTITAASLVAQENSDCFGCHGDKSATGTRKGKTISVFVNEKNFSDAVHGSLTCISCHADLEGKEFPHEDDLKPVNCGTCHSSEQELHTKSLHGQAIVRGDALAPHCNDCHGNHDILSAKNPRSPISPKEDSIPLRKVPPGRIARTETADNSSRSYTGKFFREYSRSGSS